MEDKLIEKMRELVASADEDRARRALTATLATLGERLSPDDALALSRALSRRLGEHLLSFGHDPGLGDVDTFYARIARRADLLPTTASRLARAACQALASLLPAEHAQRVRGATWPGVVKARAQPEPTSSKAREDDDPPEVEQLLH